MTPSGVLQSEGQVLTFTLALTKDLGLPGKDEQKGQHSKTSVSEWKSWTTFLRFYATTSPGSLPQLSAACWPLLTLFLHVPFPPLLQIPTYTLSAHSLMNAISFFALLTPQTLALQSKSLKTALLEWQLFSSF